MPANPANNDSKKEIASRLRWAREQAGLSQGQVAQRMGVHRPTISQIESAERNIRIEELDQFAHIVSHDLKAPLRGIANLAQWLQDDLGEQLTGESLEHIRLLQGRVARCGGGNPRAAFHTVLSG